MSATTIAAGPARVRRPARWRTVGDLVIGAHIVVNHKGDTGKVTGLVTNGRRGAARRTEVIVGGRRYFPAARDTTPVLMVR